MDDEFQPLECPNCESLVRLVEHGAKALKAHVTAKSPSGGKGLFARMTTKRGKPIADIQHNGKRVRVGFALRYDVVVDDQAALSAVFAEEITRWLTNAMREEPVKPPTTRPCSMEGTYRCRDAQNVGCEFP
jgi:hypothetical protein